VRSGVVLPRLLACRVNNGSDGLVLSQPSPHDPHIVEEQPLARALRVAHQGGSPVPLELAGVAHLAATLGVEGGLGQHDGGRFALGQDVDLEALAHETHDLSLRPRRVVAEETRLADARRYGAERIRLLVEEALLARLTT